MDPILFVAPAKLNPVDGNGRPRQNVRENVSLPALTILGSLKAGGYDVEFMDLSADGDLQTPVGPGIHRFGLSDECVLDRIQELRPAALLITSMFTSEQQLVDDLARVVRRSYPRLPIIVGGIHASLKPEWILESGDVDFVVLGEGELAIHELLRCVLGDSGDFQRVRGVAYMRNGKLTTVPPGPFLGDLGALGFCFEDVLQRDGHDYRYLEPAARRTALYNHRTASEWERCFSLYYSRGCPLHCDYCASSEKDGLKIRHMGAERMFGDFVELHERYGVKVFYNQADAFCATREDVRFLEEVREYRKGRPDFVISNPNAFYVRLFFPPADGFRLNDRLLDLLAESGVNVCTLAVETFSPRFNRKINFDRVPPPRIAELLEAIHERGMKTGIYMMYAFPDQTVEELGKDEATIASFAALDRVDWQNCMVFPGTEYYRRGLAQGWFTEASYRNGLTKGYFFHALPPEFNFSRIPTAELDAFRRRNASDFQ